MPLPGMSFFDHATSFGMIRGGHIDITVLGALQVSEKGYLTKLDISKKKVKQYRWFGPGFGMPQSDSADGNTLKDKEA